MSEQASTTPIEVGQAEFDSYSGRVVVDFWASWCGPCRSFAPVFAASAAAHPELPHLKVNVDEHPELAQRFSVQSIPTVLLIDVGSVVEGIVGAVPAHALEQLVTL